MEKQNTQSRSELWEQIFSIVSLIPRAKVKDDAVDHSSATSALEKLFLSKETKQISEWIKKAPDCVGYWLRMNAIHKPEIHHIFEDFRNPDKALCVMWGWSGEGEPMRIKDNLHKIEHFLWYGPLIIPSKEVNRE
jgi:hypothetical protein